MLILGMKGLLLFTSVWNENPIISKRSGDFEVWIWKCVKLERHTNHNKKQKKLSETIKCHIPSIRDCIICENMLELCFKESHCSQFLCRSVKQVLVNKRMDGVFLNLLWMNSRQKESVLVKSHLGVQVWSCGRSSGVTAGLTDAVNHLGQTLWLQTSGSDSLSSSKPPASIQPQV